MERRARELWQLFTLGPGVTWWTHWPSLLLTGGLEHEVPQWVPTGSTRISVRLVLRWWQRGDTWQVIITHVEVNNTDRKQRQDLDQILLPKCPGCDCPSHPPSWEKISSISRRTCPNAGGSWILIPSGPKLKPNLKALSKGSCRSPAS